MTQNGTDFRNHALLRRDRWADISRLGADLWVAICSSSFKASNVLEIAGEEISHTRCPTKSCPRPVTSRSADTGAHQWWYTTVLLMMMNPVSIWTLCSIQLWHDLPFHLSKSFPRHESRPGRGCVGRTFHRFRYRNSVTSTTPLDRQIVSQSCRLFGVTVLQSYQYYIRYPNDSRFCKLKVRTQPLAKFQAIDWMIGCSCLVWSR